LQNFGSFLRRGIPDGIRDTVIGRTFCSHKIIRPAGVKDCLDRRRASNRKLEQGSFFPPHRVKSLFEKPAKAPRETRLPSGRARSLQQ
jgi:hypothetical protein